MGRITEAELRDLRLKYEAAYDAYQSCVRALADAGRLGKGVSRALLDSEAKALRELNEARERYREALVQVAFLSDDPSP